MLRNIGPSQEVTVVMYDWLTLSPRDLYRADKVQPWFYGCQRLGGVPAYESVGYSWQEYHVRSVKVWD